MPPKRNHCRKSNKPSPVGAGAGAMAHCVFPQDVMVSILTRLPVKSILRFRSVCKPWCKLFATARFVKMHRAQLSDNPENQAAVIYSLSDYHDHTMSLLKTESDGKEPIPLDHPFPEVFFRMDLVGSYNGLVCMACPPLGQCIVLWNPATKLFKTIRLSKVEFGSPEMVSLGLGYDDEADDFKVVRIVCLMKSRKMRVGVEVYSSVSDSWKTIKLGFQFYVLWTKNHAVVNGNPYWVAKVDDNAKAQRDLAEVLVCFDVKKMAFSVVPLSGFDPSGRGEVTLVDWKGSLGAIVGNKMAGGRVESFDVWVLDAEIWGKKHTFGIRPVDMKVDRILECSKNGKILGECPNGKLFVFNPETGLVEEIVMDGARKGSFEIYGYAESLASLKGMEKVVVKKEEADVGGGDAPEVELTDFDVASLLRSYLENLNVVGN